MSFKNKRVSPFLDQRKKRKQDLYDIIKKNPDLGLKKLKAVFSMRTGNTYKKIDEYLEELEDAGLIDIDRTNPLFIKVTSVSPPSKTQRDK